MNSTVFPAVILAGGRSSRMGGYDKALLPLAGKSMLERVIARIGPQSSPLALNSNRDQDFAAFGLPVLRDEFPDAGPLAGILAAMTWAGEQGSSHVLTVPVDTPFLPGDLAARLAAHSKKTGPSLAASRDNAVRLHPTAGLWPVMLAGDLRRFLLTGKRRVREFAAAYQPAIVVWESVPVDPFMNVNTPMTYALQNCFWAKADTISVVTKQASAYS